MALASLSAASGGRAQGAAAAGVRPVSLWLAYWNMPAAVQSAVANAGVVGTASPFWYAITGDATVVDNPGAGDAAVVSALRAAAIRIVPTVTETADMQDFDRILASAGLRAAMVRALVTVARSGPYSGLDLDFEDFAVDARHETVPADAAAALFPAFVAQACAALHALHDSCTVTVMPRTSSAQTYWRGRLATWVYDFAALAAAADRVRVMAYDDNAPGGPPGPVAPYAWVQQVIAYARTTMPTGKVELALPAYGYDWSAAGAAAVTARQAPLLAAAHAVKLTWDAAQREVTFAYAIGRQRHVVWYEDAAADYDRALLARTAGFAGIDLWSAGDEDPAVWPLLRRLYA